jgi:hypothetical protein
MPIPIVNWRARINPTDADVDGEPQPVPWLFGSNAAVGLDLSNALNAGEVITSPVSTLRRLPAFGETDYTDDPGKLLGGPVVTGTFVTQRLQNLERGYVYRWEVLFGASDNRRGRSLLVRCGE